MSDTKREPPFLLGNDLGGTKILAEVYDNDFKLAGSKKKKTKPELSQEEGLARLLKTAHEALGGGRAAAMPGFYLSKDSKAMAPKIMDALQGTCDLKIAKPVEHATALGTADWAKAQVAA